MKVHTLILNRNSLYDAGILLLSVGLFERYLLQEEQNVSFNTSKLPLEILGLKDCKITDHGFKYFLQRFEAIYLRNLHSNKDFEVLIDLDVSENNLTESSLKYLADIIKKFHAFKSLNLSNLMKMKDTGLIEFAKALKDS